ncbi:phosphoadenosine phosphosulfate reductase family protein [Photobacterium lutimaris]|uniref:Phosphoadenosine phosphosulphate reductase domain-containing protein n=1 Tax=Photobacterium lutimaris TaxID=388278 RepID=A0A2T3ITS0_9GAMM|nr:phosphoadenosine phosphosulfate reductase family protein [Photobacterium lutimaris]PSU31743.1 hypothetical protein C9I99_21395 [Photobacterium lutimaris]TDR72613.1 phosphoadenosine phosphosulfate reductase family protein [Photobacterium lutimaris]
MGEMYPINVVAEPTKHDLVRNVILKHIPNYNYHPDTSNNKKHVLGLSGGVDSSVLAAVLLCMHPEIDWTIIFTDTLDEPKECYAILDTIESLFGVKVNRLVPELGLFGKFYWDIEKTGKAFLPSPKARFCTGLYKVKPWNDFLKSDVLTSDDDICVAYAGIRFDERHRRGILGIDRVETDFPFVSLKVERSAVMAIAAELNLLSATYYRGRSRSGCERCVFLSQNELVALRTWDPAKFAEGGLVEKLSEDVQAAFSQDRFTSKSRGFYTSWPLSSLILDGKDAYVEQTLLGPQSLDRQGVNWDFFNQPHKEPKKKPQAPKSVPGQIDIVGFDQLTENAETKGKQSKVFFVAIENYVSASLSMFAQAKNAVWQQRLISYSTSVSGITKQLRKYISHRREAAEGFWSSLAKHDEESHVTILAIEIDGEYVPDVSYDDSYTWQSRYSYQEIDYYCSLFERIAHLESCKAVMLEPSGYDHITKTDSSCFYGNHYGEISKLGSIIGVGHFKPPAYAELDIDDDSYDGDINTIRCVMCSI